MIKIEYNAMTGITTERELTPQEIAEMEIDIPIPTNDDIRELRAQAYKESSDSLYMAWQKYLTLGDERADQAKRAWLDDLERINYEFPYS